MQIALEQANIGGNTGVRDLHVSISGIPKFGPCELTSAECCSCKVVMLQRDHWDCLKFVNVSN